MPEKDFSMLAAAISIDSHFYSDIVHSPTRKDTILAGFGESQFDFTPEELEQILAISAKNFKDFALQLDRVYKGFYPKSVEDITKNFPPNLGF